MAGLTVLLPEPLNWSAYFIVPLFTFLYTFLLGNLIITFSVLTDRISTYLSITISMFLFILFATGLLVEFDFYPKTVGTLLSYSPLSMILSDLRGILFFNHLEWGPIIISVAIALGWTWMNGYLLKHKLKQ